MSAIRAANLAIAFILELGALVALGYWGFRAGETPDVRIMLGIGAPLVAAVVWGLFVAPKAVRPVPPAARLALKALVFGAAWAGLAAAGLPTLGLVFFLVAAVNQSLLLMWKQ